MAVRWTDLAEWRGPTVNSGDGDQYHNEADDQMREHRGVVLHIADGYYEGTIGWQRKPDVNVSSHFVVAGPRDKPYGAADGKTAQVVEANIAAWTQRAGNGHWLSVECSGFSGDKLSPAQVESCAQLLARAHRDYGVPLQIATSPSGRGLGHHSMGAESGVDWGHSECPGPAIKMQKPAILARAIAIIKGDDNVALKDDPTWKAFQGQWNTLRTDVAYAIWRLHAMAGDLPVVAGGPAKGAAVPVNVHQQEDRTAAALVGKDVAALLARVPMDPAALAAAIVAALPETGVADPPSSEAMEAAVRAAFAGGLAPPEAP